MKTTWPILLIVLIFCGCANKYNSYKTQYTHKSENGLPDYSNLYYWASHPWKWDPADSTPKPLINEPKDTVVDIFFLHPTTYTSKRRFRDWNVSIDDAYHNAKTDYASILYQATAFNQHARLFAPRYREAHIKTFFSKDSALATATFGLAYEDIKKAFEYYLKTWNNSRPIIIAAHSQGALHAERLLKEFFEDKPLGKQLIAAYVMGWPVPKDYFSSLKMCVDSIDINCLCSWRTFRRGFMPKYIKRENGSSYVTNPLNWKTDKTYAPKSENKGTVVKFNKIYKQTTDARNHKGVLWVKRPRFPWSFMYLTRNYHIGDINLFYINIRKNVEQRINAYFQKYPAK